MNSLFFGSFLAAMATGIPIAIAMALGSLVYIWISGTIPPLTVIHRMVGGSTAFRCWPCHFLFWPATS